MLLLVLAAASATPPLSTRPNVVFILVDDLGHNDVGYTNKTGGRMIQSPHIDKLAAEGIILTQNYVQEMCTPTRAALMTGRYPFRYGMTAYTIGASKEERAKAIHA